MAASSITKWVLFFALISGLLLQNHVEAQAAQEEEKQPCKVFCGLFGLFNRKLIEAPAPKPHHYQHHKRHHKGAAAPKSQHHKHQKKSAPAPAPTPAPAATKWKHYRGYKKGSY